MTAMVAAGGYGPASAAPVIGYVQGAAINTAPGSNCQTTVQLSQPVGAGDLLVAWIGGYGAVNGSSVSDSINGSWTRAPKSLTFPGPGGTISLFYLAGSRASSSSNPMVVTIDSCGTWLMGTVADYSGVAASSPLDQMGAGSGQTATVNVAAPGATPAGELVFGAVVTDYGPGTAPAPGSSQGVAFTARAASSSGDAAEQDITSSAAGAQQMAASWPPASGVRWFAVVATFQPASAPPPPPSYAQGTAFATGTRVTQLAVPLAQPVTAGDLLVGWFSQYNVAGQVQVSDSVNGSWTRAPGSLSFTDGGGDIALYYKVASKAATVMTVTVSAPAAAYLEGTVAEYRHVATSGALDQIAAARGAAPVGNNTTLSSGTTAPVPVGELIYGALITGGSPTHDTPGTGFTARAATASGSAFEEDHTPGQSGAQQATVTIQTPTDWYLVVATFRPGP